MAGTQGKASGNHRSGKQQTEVRELVSKAEYARRKGVSRQAVYKALEWRITPAEIPDGRIDVALADRLWRENTHPGLGIALRASGLSGR